MLTAEQIQSREGRLTASRVGVLMHGDSAAIYRLWQEMIGDPEFVPEDLSGVWPVQLGITTEALNLDWFARRFGAVTRRGEVVVHPEAPWAAATLDGWSETHGCPIECKHVGGFEPRETVIARYQPQFHWQAWVTQTKRVASSIIMGAQAPIIELIEIDADYMKELITRADAFMMCVRTLTPPSIVPPVAPPQPALREVEMTGNNSWAAMADDWLSNRIPAAVFEAAAKDLKALVPSDAARCHGHGVEVKRDRAGRLTVRKAA